MSSTVTAKNLLTILITSNDVFFWKHERRAQAEEPQEPRGTTAFDDLKGLMDEDEGDEACWAMKHLAHL